MPPARINELAQLMNHGIITSKPHSRIRPLKGNARSSPKIPKCTTFALTRTRKFNFLLQRFIRGGISNTNLYVNKAI